jgi:site-specific DNA recombinase
VVGKMFFSMMTGFAEMERNLISERTKSALRFKKESQRIYSRIAPLSFDSQGDKLVQNQEEMKQHARSSECVRRA